MISLLKASVTKAKAERKQKLDIDPSLYQLVAGGDGTCPMPDKVLTFIDLQTGQPYPSGPQVDDT
jgi:hypothetical protein